MDITEITGSNRDVLSLFESRRESQLYHYYEPEPGLFITESMKVTVRALEAGYEPVCLVAEKRRIDEDAASLLEMINKTSHNIPVYSGSEELLSGIAGYKLTGGILCAFRRKRPSSMQLLLKEASRVVVLCDVGNPTNVGAIFRNAAALCMDAVILIGECSDPLYRRASRVSMGTVFSLPWTIVCRDEPLQGIYALNEAGFATTAMALCEDTCDIRDERLQREQKIAVILGNEERGLPQEVIKACQYTVKIPMARNIDSLNVAAASAVAFWELSAR